MLFSQSSEDSSPRFRLFVVLARLKFQVEFVEVVKVWPATVLCGARISLAFWVMSMVLFFFILEVTLRRRHDRWEMKGSKGIDTSLKDLEVVHMPDVLLLHVAELHRTFRGCHDSTNDGRTHTSIFQSFNSSNSSSSRRSDVVLQQTRVFSSL